MVARIHMKQNQMMTTQEFHNLLVTGIQGQLMTRTQNSHHQLVTRLQGMQDQKVVLTYSLVMVSQALCSHLLTMRWQVQQDHHTGNKAWKQSGCHFSARLGWHRDLNDLWKNGWFVYVCLWFIWLVSTRNSKLFYDGQLYLNHPEPEQNSSTSVNCNWLTLVRAPRNIASCWSHEYIGLKSSSENTWWSGNCTQDNDYTFKLLNNTILK